MKLIVSEYNGVTFVSLRKYKDMAYSDKLIFAIEKKKNKQEKKD